MKQAIRDYLQGINARVGDTVQFGWFIFRVKDEEQNVETLDFKRIASFTDDFSIADRIHFAQQETLRRLKEEVKTECTLSHSALVSKSFTPGSTNVFMERTSPSVPNDSGWYVGVTDDPLDMTSADSFERQSLSEITINDERTARFWLLPEGYRIILSNSDPKIEKSEQVGHLNSEKPGASLH